MPPEHQCKCEKIDEAENRLTRLEIQMQHLVETIDAIKATLDSLVTDKQRLLGAFGILAFLGAAMVWLADKVLDKVLK